MSVFFGACVFQKVADSAKMAEYDIRFTGRRGGYGRAHLTADIADIGVHDENGIQIAKDHAGNHQEHTADDEQPGWIGRVEKISEPGYTGMGRHGLTPLFNVRHHLLRELIEKMHSIRHVGRPHEIMHAHVNYFLETGHRLFRSTGD